MFSADLGVNQVASTPAATDPPFQKVALLLHGDGTNGAQNNTFLDSSTNAFTITRTGNVAQGTFSSFSLAEGQWSNYFDGTGDYETVATNSVFTYGTNDFTIECWFYLGKTGAQQQLIDQRNSGTATAIIPTLYVSSSNVLTYYVNGSAVITGSTTLSVGSWYHVAVSRSSTSTKMFLNGTQEGSTYSDSNNYAASRVVLGAQASSAANYLQGYLSNVRLVKGTAVYTANFTPPTSALTAITNTSLLTCQSNRLIDNSSNNFTITPAGDVKVTAFSPFAPSAAYSASTNGGSGYFDGTGDYLSTSTSASGYDVGTDHTWEGFFWINSISSASCIFKYGKEINYSPTVSLRVTTSGTITLVLIIQPGNSGTYYSSYTSTSTININTWNHFALVKQGSSWIVYINGISILTATNSGNVNPLNTAEKLYVLGAFFDGVSYLFPLNGYLSNFRTVSSAVYTANFTPPTAPLTAITNTQLLLNCTNAGIYDNAAKNDIETVGNAQISTSVKKYGTGSVYLNNSSYPASGGDYLTCLATSDLYNFGTGDFTVEMWLNPTGLSGGNYNSVFAFTPTHVNFSLYILYGKLDFWVGGSSVAGGTATISTGAWTHIAIARFGTSLKMFVNGTQDASVTNSTNITGNTGMRLGQDLYDGGNVAFYGYIDDLRITKGQALYTSNFIPPTQAFPDV